MKTLSIKTVVLRLLLGLVLFASFACLYFSQSAMAQADESTSITSPVEGNLAVDHPNIPPFYIWRRVYQKKGVTSYSKLFDVGPDGKIKEDKKFSVTIEEASEEASVHAISKYSSREEELKFEAQTATPTPLVSPSGKWKVIPPSGEEWEQDHSIQLITGDSGVVDKVDILQGGWFWSAITWNPVHDLFYGSTCEGSTTDRENAYWQFDPVSKKFNSIGAGIGSFDISPDGEWIVWNDGVGMAWVDHQINIYCIKTNKNYLLTSGHSDNAFYKWAGDPSVAKWDEINAYIQAGKKLFFSKDYEGAIAEYKKAIDLDPLNGTAYGYMGYSCYRNDQLVDAEADLRKVLQISWTDPMAYYNLALVSWAKKDPKQAAEWLRQLYFLDYSWRKKVQSDSQFNEIVQSAEYKEMVGKWWGKKMPRHQKRRVEAQ